MDSFSRQLVHDYEGVMTKIAGLGYNGVEIFYGLHGGYTAEGLKKFFNSINLEVISSHVETEDTEENLKYLPRTGCKYIINPGLAAVSYTHLFSIVEFTFTLKSTTPFLPSLYLNEFSKKLWITSGGTRYSVSSSSTSMFRRKIFPESKDRIW